MELINEEKQNVFFMEGFNAGKEEGRLATLEEVATIKYDEGEVDPNDIPF